MLWIGWRKTTTKIIKKVFSRKGIPTILFLSTALINHIPDKLLYRQVIWNLEWKSNIEGMWGLVCYFISNWANIILLIGKVFSLGKIVIICSGCLKWILQENIRLQIFFIYVHARIKKIKKEKVKWSAKMDGQVRYVCDDSLSNDHSVIKVWKCHLRSAASQLLKHYGSVICCNICVRPKELYSKGCSEWSLKRDV